MLSVIIPACNEEQSLPILIERFIQTFRENRLNGELVIVNDGSTDETGKIAEELSRRYNNVRVFHHKRRMGKTAALLNGFTNASGDILAIIDADLQYAPEDLPKLLALIENGYAVVNGWRRQRKDSIFKKIPSSLYNIFSRILFGLDLHDHNSGFKVLKREVLEDINLRMDQHRFILNVAHYKGYKVGEVEIQHFPRKYGKSKYGPFRIISGFLDLISLRLQLTFLERPILLFGFSGIILFLAGFFTALSAVVLNLFYGEPFSRHYGRLILAALFMITGIQAFFFGFIADMIANLRNEQKGT